MNKVKEIRKERQITQDYLARMVGISRRYLSLIETN
ncbi:MAG TPA: helix-turn-helix transcriptional regulator, partial [Candidatus Merdenecus merdavium]|nr:helix-turn-helix transcriptional regulator [Candidatus Merdenecus merdavium]